MRILTALLMLAGLVALSALRFFGRDPRPCPHYFDVVRGICVDEPSMVTQPWAVPTATEQS